MNTNTNTRAHSHKPTLQIRTSEYVMCTQMAFGKCYWKKKKKRKNTKDSCAQQKKHNEINVAAEEEEEREGGGGGERERSRGECISWNVFKLLTALPRAFSFGLISNSAAVCLLPATTLHSMAIASHEASFGFGHCQQLITANGSAWLGQLIASDWNAPRRPSCRNTAHIWP